MMFRDLILLTRIVFSFIWQNKQKEAKDQFGILCVDRDNVRGGLNLFKNKNDVMTIDIDPGNLFIYDNVNQMQYKETPLLPLFAYSDQYQDGYKDVIYLSRSIV